VDARTYDTLADLFTADGVVCLCRHEGERPRRAARILEPPDRELRVHYHYLHSHVVTELATTTAAGIVTGHAEHASTALCAGALRYDDQYLCENGVWRIRVRQLSTRYYPAVERTGRHFHEGGVAGRPKDTAR